MTDSQQLFERVIYLDGDEAKEFLDMHLNERADTVADALAQWHYPGEHECAIGTGAGAADTVEYIGRYRLITNHGLGYIALASLT